MKLPIALVFGGSLALSAQDLPNVLGNPPANTSEEWISKQRPATLAAFQKHVYGRAPVGRPEKLTFKTVKENADAMNGAATHRIVKIGYAGEGGAGSINLILFIPNKVEKPAPGFLLICNRDRSKIDPSRKEKFPIWPAEEIVARGYVAATFFHGDVDLDEYDGFENGVHGIFDSKSTRVYQ